jgi:hypothetical protein
MLSMRATLLAAMLVCATSVALAQVPQPFPKPGQKPPVISPVEPPATQQTTPATQRPPAAPSSGQPDEATLGVPVYPAAQFIASYDAGKGQRYYLFGTMTSYAEIVQYYRNTLRQRGDEVFREPPVHQFDLGRFREQTMAFPPSVTVKDYTWGSGKGYLDLKPGAQPQRYPTVIQIVPNPPAVAK